MFHFINKLDLFYRGRKSNPFIKHQTQRQMKQTELITNPDGTLFHLHICSKDISDKIVIVGDQDRVDLVASFFESVRFSARNREFRTITGTYRGKEITVMSSGIGTDNIDILINELDAAINFNLESREPHAERKRLTIVRLGTSGALQGDIETGSFIATERAIGFDNVMNYYSGIESITDTLFEKSFMEFVGWSPRLGTPYIVDADSELLARFSDPAIRNGYTISAPGFYAPQGRTLYLEPGDTLLNEKLERFSINGRVITNYEMESSAIYGLSRLLGHKALTICAIIGNRVTGEFLSDYKPAIRELTDIVLERI